MTGTTPEPRVDVELVHEPGASWIAVVSLHGEHDLATRQTVQQTLEGLFGDVLVDLSPCTFMDSTLIGVLIGETRRRARDGHRLELVVPEANVVVTRTFTTIGARPPLLTLHTSSPLAHVAPTDVEP